MKRSSIIVFCIICAMLLPGCGNSSAPAATVAPTESAEVSEPATEAVSPKPEESAAPVATLPDASLTEDTGSASGEEDPASQYDLAKSFVDKTLPELTEAIGDPISSSYATSCLGPGQDGELVYDGFRVYTYNNGETETILDVLED